MGKDSLLIGAKPKRGRAAHNQNNPPRHAEAGANQIRQPVEDREGEFGDGTELSQDWRLIPLIICEVIKQSGVFNLSQDGNEQNYKIFLHKDLVKHLKPAELKKKGKKYSYLALSNLKNALKHMKTKGLLKTKSSGKTMPGSDGNKEKWEFETKQNVGVDFVKTKVDASPVGIVFDVAIEFFGLKKGIYTVRGTKMVEGENEENTERHMLIIVGYGFKEGKIFFLVQNSWGKNEWGVQGYGRIMLDDNSNFVLIFPSCY